MQNELIKIMNRELVNAKTKNSLYSLRAYARKLGIQVSALSEILNGKRTITPKMAKKIAASLGLNPNEFTVKKEESTTDSNLSLDYFRVISDWYYFAILSLAETKEFTEDSNWIASRLNIRVRDAKSALNKLFDLGLLEKNEKGKVVVTGIQYKTPTDILDLSLKNHTLQTLELAAQSLREDPLELRDFSTVTMAIDPKKIPQAKKMIKDFRRKLTKVLESEEQLEVYKLAIELFPLTKKLKKDNL